jgi:hypothetical protein
MTPRQIADFPLLASVAVMKRFFAMSFIFPFSSFWSGVDQAKLCRICPM